MPFRRSLLPTTIACLLSACAATSGADPSDIAELPGNIELNQGPTYDLPLGGDGTGTVFFHGQMYRFNISGLGLDGSAVAAIQTTGQAYRVHDIARFVGTYRRAPSGASLPAQAPAGLWLQNEQGTIIHLDTPPQGKMPDIDGDGVLIVFR